MASTNSAAGTMRALVKTAKGSGNIEVRTVPVPQISSPHDVLIEVSAAGVCGTDIHILHDEFTYYPPVILGHEFSGTVVETGPAVTRVKVGERVVGEPHAKACGVCDLCRQGYSQICPHKRSPGWGMDGAFTDYLVMPEHLLHAIPEGVPMEVAALCEPLAIVVSQVLERGGVEPMDTVAIVGAGAIGLLSAFAAKQCGAHRIVMMGVDADEKVRFDAARRMGVDRVVNVQRENAKDAILELTGGKAADYVIEASGSEAGINTAIDILRVHGRLSAVGITKAELAQVAWNKLITKMADVYFNFSSSYTSWDRALKLMTKSKSLETLITHWESIESWKGVFDALEKGDGIKALFIPERMRA